MSLKPQDIGASSTQQVEGGRELEIKAGTRIILWDGKANTPNGFVTHYNHLVRPRIHSIVVWGGRQFAVWGRGAEQRAVCVG